MRHSFFIIARGRNRLTSTAPSPLGSGRAPTILGPRGRFVDRVAFWWFQLTVALSACTAFGPGSEKTSSVCPVVQLDSTQDSLRIRAHVPRRVRVDAPVAITVSATNITARTLRLTYTYQFARFTVVVIDPRNVDGEPVLPSPAGIATYRPTNATLSPGDSVTWTRVWDLRRGREKVSPGSFCARGVLFVERDRPPYHSSPWTGFEVVR